MKLEELCCGKRTETEDIVVKKYLLECSFTLPRAGCEHKSMLARGVVGPLQLVMRGQERERERKTEADVLSHKLRPL